MVNLQRRVWANGLIGNTPLEKDRLNGLEQDLAAALVQLARDPSQLFSGAIMRDVNGAEISAVVQWPDGVSGTYSGTASATVPGSVSAYTVTREGAPMVTFRQPTVTRDPVTGEVSNRPPITIT